MRPITNFIPKALLPVGEKTNIDLIIERMFGIGIKKIGINICHLKEKMKQHLLPYGEKIIISEEERILGTSGGIRRIAEQLEAGVYLIHNSDVFAEIDFEKVIEEHKKVGLPITMVVRPGGLDLDLDDGLVDFSSTGYTYCGIGIINRDPALKLKRDLIPSVSGLEIKGFIYDCPWFDIGSPDGYLNCVRHTGGFIAPDADLEETEIETACYVGSGVRLRNGLIKNSVILPGTILPDGDEIEDAIIAKEAFIIR